jgi:hypothetical protein
MGTGTDENLCPPFALRNDFCRPSPRKGGGGFEPYFLGKPSEI